jgi:hypothetical protein
MRISEEAARPLANVIYEIAFERVRQVEEEHYSAAHDDTHYRGELVLAAVAYALPPEVLRWLEGNDVRLWPWAGEPNFKGDRRRDLVRAAALIVAEIERLDRAPMVGR